ncbi:unnamed protein product [Angiostrongylus costaricensis]|uniref:PH_9 domain-containing protein n=1 Tax=Angiostrongylus costaricensis TaxID=334426 RepID=A0A0R3PIT1_ANGCS|nr:unnamed protein product [Angiostrongylus costaricensis]
MKQHHRFDSPKGTKNWTNDGYHSVGVGWVKSAEKPAWKRKLTYLIADKSTFVECLSSSEEASSASRGMRHHTTGGGDSSLAALTDD